MPRPRVTFSRNGHHVLGLLRAAEGDQQQGVVRASVSGRHAAPSCPTLAPMLTPYRRVLGLPGALRFSLTGLVARLPISMVSLGIVLLVSARDRLLRAGRRGLGVVPASPTRCSRCCRPGCIDRLGQSRVLPVAVAVFAAGHGRDDGGRRGWTGRRPWPHLCAALSGAALPQIGSCVRARWSLLVPDSRAAADRLRLRGGGRRDGVHPRPDPGHRAGHRRAPAGRAGRRGAGGAGRARRCWSPSSAPSRRPPAGRTGGARRADAVAGAGAPLVVCAFTLGALLGGAEVATVAFSDEHGAKPLSRAAARRSGRWAACCRA